MVPETAPRLGGNLRADSRVARLATIQEIWADVLGAEQIGPDDDFFDLGGTSLGLATAAALIGERIGVDVPLRILFTASTPAKMADLIAELRAGSDRDLGDGITPFFPDWVVPLQPEGGARPVFVFPGGRGSRVVLAKDAQIAAMVGRVHPFYGFHREEAHIATDRDDWVAATATDYMTQIRNIQNRGPYLLYAICSGAPFAWEVARQLVDSGADIGGMFFYEALLAVDSGEPGRPRYIPLGPPPGRAPTYVPEPLAVDLTLLMTEVWQAEGKSDGWFQVARGRIETVVMPGSTPGEHALYYRREAMIAKHLSDWIARTEGRWGAQ
jgi:acyl carrier protein